MGKEIKRLLILNLKNTHFTNTNAQCRYDINIDQIVLCNKVPFGKKIMFYWV